MEATARAENAVIAHAIGRGYVNSTQLDEARQSLARQYPGGRPDGALLKLLRTDYLDPGLEAELLRVYRQAIEGEDALDSTIQIEVPEITDDASDDPERFVQRRPPSSVEADVEDLRTTQEYEAGPPVHASNVHRSGAVPSPHASARFAGTASWRSSKGRGPLADGNASDTWDEEDVLSVGPYRILGELARGGMGIVYRARHVDLPREVAIKMLLAGQQATPAQLERFNTEARAAARLRHPNLVAIHDVGIQGGHPYVVMDYIPGETLHDRIRSRGPLPLDDAARITLSLANALDYAHEHQVIHRDVTPLNVLMTPEGEPLLTDFGLAKELDAVGTGVTQTGQFVGTPAYTPPEQAAGRLDLVDHRCDVYGLGATLYACLTGKPPFDAETPLEVLAQITDGKPPSIRSLRPDVSPALEAICVRCLQKEPSRRPASMRALATELEAALGKASSSSSRHLTTRLDAALGQHPRLLLGLIAALVVALGLTLAQKRSADRLAAERLTALEQAETEQRAAAAAAAARLSREAEQELAHQAQQDQLTQARAKHAALERQTARALLAAGFASLAARRLPEAGLAFARAHVAATDATLRRTARTGAREAVAQVGLRGLLQSPTGLVLAVRYLPSGDRLIGATAKRAAVEWDLTQGKVDRTYAGHTRAVSGLALSPTGQYLLSGSEDRTIRLWNRETGSAVRLLKGLRAPVMEVEFTRGRQAAVVAAGKFVSVIDLSKGTRDRRTPEHPLPVRALDVSPNQRLAVTACGDLSARVFDLQTGQLVTIITSRTPIVAARFRDGGRQVLTLGALGNLGLWTTIGGKLLSALPPTPRGGAPIVVRLSPDEAFAAIGTRTGFVRVIALATSRELALFRTRGRRAIDLAFSPDGRTLAVASAETVELRSLNAIIATDRGYGVPAAVRFAPGGGLAWFTSPGVVVANPTTKREQTFPATGSMLAFDLSRDGRWLATAGKSGVVVYERDTERVVDRIPTLGVSLDFSPDGRLLALAGSDPKRGQELRLRDLTAKQDVERTKTPHRFPIGATAFSPDGRWLLTGDMGGQLHTWSVGAGALKLQAKLELPGVAANVTRRAVTGASFTADGRLAITGHADGHLVLWDPKTGQPRKHIPAHAERIVRVVVSSDGSTLATSSYDHTVKLWHLPSGELLRTIDAGNPVIGCDFSPDGETLVTGIKDRKVLFWNVSRPGIPNFAADPVAAVRAAVGLPLAPQPKGSQ